MQTYVALLRGINVGGNNRLPMDDLTSICTDLGWQDVRTYIASGNVVFRTEGGDEALAAALHKALPFDVPVVVLRASELKARLSHCPIVPNEAKNLHAFFCLDAPDVDQDVIAHYRKDEKVVVKGHTVWLYTPSGFSNSTLAEHFNRVITGTAYTARNLNTVKTLVGMCAA